MNAAWVSGESAWRVFKRWMQSKANCSLPIRQSYVPCLLLTLLNEISQCDRLQFNIILIPPSHSVDELAIIIFPIQKVIILLETLGIAIFLRIIIVFIFFTNFLLKIRIFRTLQPLGQFGLMSISMSLIHFLCLDRQFAEANRGLDNMREPVQFIVSHVAKAFKCKQSKFAHSVEVVIVLILHHVV